MTSNKANPGSRLALAALILSMLTAGAFAKTIYVDAGAAGANDGSSWVNAYPYLQEALADAKAADKPVEIRVARGVYRPDQGLVAIPEFDWRTTTFQLINGVALEGGYAGLRTPDPNARDVELYETILSGDLNGDDADVNGPEDLLSEPTRADNSYHVVTGSGTDDTAVLNGFSIIGGNALGGEGGTGGGMANVIGSPTLSYCTFKGNLARNGGGMYNSRSGPTLNHCVFQENAARQGGGMQNENSKPALIGCTFSGNYAWRPAGGMYNDHSDALVRNCTFVNNKARWWAGAIESQSSSPQLIHCTFSGNVGLLGGGVVFCDESDLTFENCTFVGNKGLAANAFLLRSIENANHIRAANCIFRDGGNEIDDEQTSTVDITYSDIEGGYPGEGNIDADPCFANPGYWAGNPNMAGEPNYLDLAWVEGDYHLKSQAGRWDPNGESWVKDDVTSPCIDTGDPNSDWSGETWPNGQRINMGAYGGTAEASMSTQPQPMFLPHIAYIYSSDAEAAGSFQSLLVRYGCSTALIALDEAPRAELDAYDLIIVGSDTGSTTEWGDAASVAAVDGSGKPIVGLGEGGYAFFGQLGLFIGWPNGMHERPGSSIYAVDPNTSLFSTPYPIEIPQDGQIELYTVTDDVLLYLSPVPETVTALAGSVGNPGYYPVALQDDRYVFWGFTESPSKMTEVGKRLFINLLVRTANAAW
jgi:Right handed beta helix region/Disaggregatase related